MAILLIAAPAAAQDEPTVQEEPTGELPAPQPSFDVNVERGANFDGNVVQTTGSVTLDQRQTIINRGPTTGTWILTLAGGAAYIAGWAAYGLHLGRRSRLEGQPADQIGFLDDQQTYDVSSAAATIAGGAGSLMLSAAIIANLPRSDDIPWWAWSAGGAGLVALGAGVATLARSSDCLDAHCTRRDRRHPGGTMALGTSAVLLSLFLTEAFGGVRPEVQASREQVLVGLRWAL